MQFNRCRNIAINDFILEMIRTMSLFNRSLVIASWFSVLVIVASTAPATAPPFTEEFASDTAFWGDNSSGPLTYVSSGGPDGSGFARTTFAFSDPNSGGDSVVLYRGQDEFGSSGGAFEGNWVADGIRIVTAQVKHNAPSVVNYFMRGSGPANFPGAVAVDFTPVAPNTWTEVSFNLNPHGPQIVSTEGSSWNDVFSNIGHLQFGVDIPAGLAGNPAQFTFDIDNISIATPEPAALCLAGLAFIGVVTRRRR